MWISRNEVPWPGHRQGSRHPVPRRRLHEHDVVDYDKKGGNITVQYVSYGPVGFLNPACGVGSTGCATFNNYAIGLSS